MTKDVQPHEDQPDDECRLVEQQPRIALIRPDDQQRDSGREHADRREHH